MLGAGAPHDPFLIARSFLESCLRTLKHVTLATGMFIKETGDYRQTATGTRTRGADRKATEGREFLPCAVWDTHPSQHQCVPSSPEPLNPLGSSCGDGHLF